MEIRIVKKKIILTLGGCSDINGIKVIRCQTEEEIIKKWVKLINDIDPDIITGYNIFGFDFDYMYKRAIELGCADQLCNVGKIKEHIKECLLKEIVVEITGLENLYHLQHLVIIF